VITLFRTLGILAIAGGLLWMVVAELVLHQSSGAHVRLVLLAGVVSLAGSLIFSILGRVSAKVASGRCRRCGKPVQPGHVYCSDHFKDAVNEYRDHQRQKGDGG
jgi:hypothetical protein